MNVVSLYIYTDTTSKRLELFNDEKISVTSAVSNFNDLGKIYTDFTQSFTIPASKKNNKILSHWYESSIDNGYDHRKRYDAYIEVNSVLFKKGNIQLEKANKKNGFIESYTVTFYGNLTQLKDKFKDDKLNTLDFSSLNHTYNSTNVINRINPTGTSYLVSYPLIGSRRKFYYKSGASHEDITQTAGAIQWNELFPAVPLWKVFEFIQTKYGVTFTGSFFSLDQWSKLYLYLKNADVLQYKSEPLLIDFTAKSGVQPALLDLTTNVLSTTWDFSTSSIRRNYVELVITTTSTNYRITVTDNNLPFATYDNLSGNTTINVLNTTFADNPSINNFRFYFSSETSSSFTSYVKYEGIVAFAKTILVQATSPSQTVVSNIAIKNYVPDITVNDFITGIIKAFNLMVIPKDINTFEFLPLEMYYNAGKILDITKYTYADEMEIERPKLFKAINFQYEKSNNILNNAYRGLYNTEYGDLIYTNSNSSESSNYEIKLPFENVLFERATGYNFETATIIDKDLKPYTPKPMLIYNNGELPTDLTGSDRFYVTTESGHSHQDNYIRFSNEYNSLPTDATFSYLMTMNFGNEQSPWYNVLAPKGLYFRHYKNYIDNLYNIKTRVIKCKALFPTSLLNSSVTNGSGRALGIALNDRLVIRNKRYIINNMTIDLTTGEANLELITDYRGVNAASSVGYKYASYDTVQVDKTAQVVDEVIYLNDYDSFSLKGAENFLVYTPTLDNVNDITLTVTIPANSGADRTDRIGIEYYIDGVLQKTEYINFLQTAI
jgi:hypothetical protein